MSEAKRGRGRPKGSKTIRNRAEVDLQISGLPLLQRVISRDFLSTQDFIEKMVVAGVKASYPQLHESLARNSLFCELGLDSQLKSESVRFQAEISTFRAELTELRSLINTSKEGE
jgi:hypothetical protein